MAHVLLLFISCSADKAGTAGRMAPAAARAASAAGRRVPARGPAAHQDSHAAAARRHRALSCRSHMVSVHVCSYGIVFVVHHLAACVTAGLCSKTAQHRYYIQTCSAARFLHQLAMQTAEPSIDRDLCLYGTRHIQLCNTLQSGRCNCLAPQDCPLSSVLLQAPRHKCKCERSDWLGHCSTGAPAKGPSGKGGSCSTNEVDSINTLHAEPPTSHAHPPLTF
jgi:hypothetical protein